MSPQAPTGDPGLAALLLVCSRVLVQAAFYPHGGGFQHDGGGNGFGGSEFGGNGYGGNGNGCNVAFGVFQGKKKNQKQVGLRAFLFGAVT